MFYGADSLIFQKAADLGNRPTAANDLLWTYLKENHLWVEFTRHHPIANYVIDFYCPELKIAIEINASEGSEDTDRNNKIKEDALKGLGISAIHFHENEVFNSTSGVVEKIKTAIRQVKLTVKNVPFSSGEILIPAIDIIDGHCVRLTQGDYLQKKIYNKYPLEVAKQFEEAGVKRLHLVDLDGAKAGAVKNWKVLEAIAGKTKLAIDFGGGIKTENDVNIIFESGAALATVGSIAVKDETAFTGWIEQFGPEKFLLGADVKGEKIAVGGWLETTDIWVYDFIEKYIGKGIQQIFCTDVAKDGKMEGPSIALYKNIIDKFPSLHFIASGGVSSVEDIHKLIEAGCGGVIVGKAIYEGKISLADISRLIREL